jgi:hypothetical protein
VQKANATADEDEDEDEDEDAREDVAMDDVVMVAATMALQPHHA